MGVGSDNHRAAAYAGRFKNIYFLFSLLFASVSAVSSASVAFTLTSGSTPTTAQSGSR